MAGITPTVSSLHAYAVVTIPPTENLQNKVMSIVVVLSTVQNETFSSHCMDAGVVAVFVNDSCAWGYRRTPCQHVRTCALRATTIRASRDLDRRLGVPDT